MHLEFSNPLSGPSPFSKFLYLVSISTPPPHSLVHSSLSFNPFTNEHRVLIQWTELYVSVMTTPTLAVASLTFSSASVNAAFLTHLWAHAWPLTVGIHWGLVLGFYSFLADLVSTCSFLATWSQSVKVLVPQLCLTLCDPMDCDPPASSVFGITQARILEWVAIPFSRESSQLRDWTQIFCIDRRILYLYTTWKAQPDVNDTQINVSNSGLSFGLQTWISTSHMIFSQLSKVTWNQTFKQSDPVVFLSNPDRPSCSLCSPHCSTSFATYQEPRIHSWYFLLHPAIHCQTCRFSLQNNSASCCCCLHRLHSIVPGAPHRFLRQARWSSGFPSAPIPPSSPSRSQRDLSLKIWTD